MTPPRRCFQRRPYRAPAYRYSREVPGVEPPRWEKGEPANLAAAVCDALEWLRLATNPAQPRFSPLGVELIEILCEHLERFSGAVYDPLPESPGAEGEGQAE